MDRAGIESRFALVGKRMTSVARKSEGRRRTRATPRPHACAGTGPGRQKEPRSLAETRLRAAGSQDHSPRGRARRGAGGERADGGVRHRPNADSRSDAAPCDRAPGGPSRRTAACSSPRSRRPASSRSTSSALVLDGHAAWLAAIRATAEQVRELALLHKQPRCAPPRTTTSTSTSTLDRAVLPRARRGGAQQAARRTRSRASSTCTCACGSSFRGGSGDWHEIAARTR